MPIIFPYVTRGFVAYDGDPDFTYKRFTTVSIAIRLIDEFTGEEPVGNIAVKLKREDDEKSMDRKPIKNRSGYYCFTDLENANYEIIVESDFYRPPNEKQTFAIKDKIPADGNLDRPITLTPKTSYPFPTTSTSLRGIVTDSSERPVPLPKATVEVSLKLPEQDPIARLKDDVKMNFGTLTLVLKDNNKPIKANDILLIRDSDTPFIEFCQIEQVGPKPQSYMLVESTKFKHALQTPVYLVTAEPAGVTRKTTTDQNGEFLIYLKSVKAQKFLARITVTRNDYQPFPTDPNDPLGTKNFDEGRDNSFGKINLKPSQP